MAKEQDEVREFCPNCFADDRGGSWGDGTQCGHCLNCGGNGTVTLPQWAVDSIRRQASWVGKRYYPATEDREMAAERAALLELVRRFPGRTVRLVKGGWSIEQRVPDMVPEVVTWGAQAVHTGRVISTFKSIAQAPTAAAALELASATLPYVPVRAFLPCGKTFPRGGRVVRCTLEADHECPCEAA